MRALGQKARKNRYNFREIKEFGSFLEHSPTLENPEDNDSRNCHQEKNDEPCPIGVSDEPTKLDVHAEEAGYQGRRHEHEGHEGEHLHDLVLVEVDDTEDCVLEIFESLETEVGMVDQ